MKSLPEGSVLHLSVTVYRDRMDFVTTASDSNGFECTREALERIKAEVDRQLTDGPIKCPFRPR